MPANQLKRAERAVERIKEQAELPPETAIALEDIVEAVRNIEQRLSALEGKPRIDPTAEMGLPNRR
jgi:uncharacterized membrane protein YccC